MFFNNLLSLAIWLPILAGVLVLATGSDEKAPLARILALVGAAASFVITLPAAAISLPSCMRGYLRLI